MAIAMRAPRPWGQPSALCRALPRLAPLQVNELWVARPESGEGWAAEAAQPEARGLVWHIADAVGCPPSPRVGHAMAVSADCAFVHGGFDGAGATARPHRATPPRRRATPRCSAAAAPANTAHEADASCWLRSSSWLRPPVRTFYAPTSAQR